MSIFDILSSNTSENLILQLDVECDGILDIAFNDDIIDVENDD